MSYSQAHQDVFVLSILDNQVGVFLDIEDWWAHPEHVSKESIDRHAHVSASGAQIMKDIRPR